MKRPGNLSMLITMPWLTTSALKLPVERVPMRAGFLQHLNWITSKNTRLVQRLVKDVSFVEIIHTSDLDVQPVTLHATVGSSWASTPVPGLTKSTISVLVNGVSLKALVDTGSSESYISSSIAKRYKMEIRNVQKQNLHGLYTPFSHYSRPHFR